MRDEPGVAELLCVCVCFKGGANVFSFKCVVLCVVLCVYLCPSYLPHTIDVDKLDWNLRDRDRHAACFLLMDAHVNRCDPVTLFICSHAHTHKWWLLFQCGRKWAGYLCSITSGSLTDRWWVSGRKISGRRENLRLNEEGNERWGGGWRVYEEIEDLEERAWRRMTKTATFLVIPYYFFTPYPNLKTCY